MSIPDYQGCMLPLLQVLSDGKDCRLRDAINIVADRLKLTEEERAIRLPSGEQSLIGNRVAWAKTYLKKAGLVSNPVRGMVRITEAGLSVLRESPTSLDTEYLKRFESFKSFYSGGSSDALDAVIPSESSKTPEEQITDSVRTLRNALADDLLDKVKSMPPQFFEKLVVQLLVAMGYGGSIIDAGRAIGGTGDGGIDGIIKEDKLGLDFICIQAKRWERTVGRPEVQAFAGSMEGFRARKGVLITTAGFSRDAEDYVTRTERKIVLIDGRQLAQLMIDHNVGVETATTFELKRINHDYFENDDT